MFESLSNNLSKAFEKIKRKGLLTEQDVSEAMREIRVALLEADVALPVAKAFINDVKEKATGSEVLKSVSPGQMVVKIVQDHLTELLGSENQELSLATTPPAIIMMVGLQGSGKTTTTAKLSHHLTKQLNKKMLMASLDVARPAAQEQLATLGTQSNIDTLPIIAGQSPVDIAKRALDTGKKGGYDVVMLDTAGRLHIDEALMNELRSIRDITTPIETLLVADALTGQDAVNVAQSFHEQIGISGIILTRMDGDSRGGAALSMKHITGQAIKFVGMGEKISDLQPFHPERVASRILDMGDVVSLVEKATEEVDEKEAEQLAKKMQKGQFNLNDLAKQLKTMRKMGGLGSMMGMLPGIGKIKNQLSDANIDEQMLRRQEAIISSMTSQERRYVKVINGSRKKRIAAGAGVEVQDVNRLLKQFKQMSTMMKKMGKMDKKALMRGGLGGLGGLGDLLK